MKESITVAIDVDELKQLLVLARELGTTDAWINLAVNWAEAATKEALRLKKELEECKEKCGHQGG